MNQYVMALDQGTTSSRAILFDQQGQRVAVAQQEFPQIFPKPGWVEHDPEAIWQSQLTVARQALDKANIKADQIAAIGITNQRETTVVWDRQTGKPLYNAIVWQDRRTAAICDAMKQAGHGDLFQQRTGLVLDAYFAGTKIGWILDHVDGARKLANQGRLAAGTIDCWLVWKLTNGRCHITDSSNASRNLGYDIHRQCWDEELLAMLNVPASLLPEVVESSAIYGHTEAGLLGSEVKIAGMAGDQQAALFGQVCSQPGMVKNTYGTGSFILMNTGRKAVHSQKNLLTTIGWTRKGEITYALEGSIFIAGAVVQWLRDGLGIIKDSTEIEALASQVDDNYGVYFVPAFTGLGAPYWDQYARGTLVGLTRGTTKAHIARAALEGIAYQTVDVIRAMEEDAAIKLSELRVDGGAAVNNLLMQFQADMLGVPVVRPKNLETTALGAAYLAGLAVGFWQNLQEISEQWQVDRQFDPVMSRDQANAYYSRWREAVSRSRSWAEE